MFLVISTGDSATSTVPIVATADASIIQAALVALCDRIAPEPAEPSATPTVTRA